MGFSSHIHWWIDTVRLFAFRSGWGLSLPSEISYVHFSWSGLWWYLAIDFPAQCMLLQCLPFHQWGIFASEFRASKTIELELTMFGLSKQQSWKGDNVSQMGLLMTGAYRLRVIPANHIGPLSQMYSSYNQQPWKWPLWGKCTSQQLKSWSRAIH